VLNQVDERRMVDGIAEACKGECCIVCERCDLIDELTGAVGLHGRAMGVGCCPAKLCPSAGGGGERIEFDGDVRWGTRWVECLRARLVVLPGGLPEGDVALAGIDLEAGGFGDCVGAGLDGQIADVRSEADVLQAVLRCGHEIVDDSLRDNDGRQSGGCLGEDHGQGVGGGKVSFDELIDERVLEPGPVLAADDRGVDAFVMEQFGERVHIDRFIEDGRLPKAAPPAVSRDAAGCENGTAGVIVGEYFDERDIDAIERGADLGL